jgi:isoleucyl-tRNA synthetase
LIYKAVPSWFVKVEHITDRLLKNNAHTRWVPDFVQEKRFANWLANARDWAISRNRYWGTPIPLWVSDDLEEIVCIGSIEELKKLGGVASVTDLHRDSIDSIRIPSQKGKGMLKRVDEVFDCWFESGSMPYAQQHYPFENQKKFEESFPADFIAEGLDQTRGWFYTLLVLSTQLFDKAPFKNLIVNGLVLAADGKKMSKRLKNYPEPTLILNAYGADALRLYLINSPVVRAEPLKFREEGVRDVQKDVFLPWLNAFKFFVAQTILLHSELEVRFEYNPHAKRSENIMDRWILASCQSLVQFVREEMAAYRLYTVVPRLLRLIEDLTNWYIRFNRRRLKGESGLEDAVQALNTLFEVLYVLARSMAPFTPFLTENMYQGLKRMMPDADGVEKQSVHFLDFPEVRQEYFDPAIERAVSRMQTVILLGRIIRDNKNLPLKTPLRELVVIHPNAEVLADLRSLEKYICEELNIRTLILTHEEEQYGVKYKAVPDNKAMGAKLRKDAGKVRTALTKMHSDEIKKFLTSKRLVVEGFELTEAEIQVQRYFDTEDASNVRYHSSADKDILVLLDCSLDQTLIEEGLAREFMNRVQRLRKKSGLNPTDPIDYYYDLVEDVNEQLSKMFVSQTDFLSTSLKRPVYQRVEIQAGVTIVAEENQEINGSTFALTLVRAQRN